MADGRQPRPGVSREVRISGEGLSRLQAQLERGARPSKQVLRQWIKRYGQAASELIERYGIRVDTDGD